MKSTAILGIALAGAPLLASGQTSTADAQAIQQQQQALEAQIREQNARIQDAGTPA
jgi:type II secretory pathway pseudopilin PulG